MIHMICVYGCNLAANHSHEDLPDVYYHTDFFKRAFSWYQLMTAPLRNHETHHRLHILRRIPANEDVADSMRAALDTIELHESLVTDGNKCQFHLGTIYNLQGTPAYWNRLYIHPFGLKLRRQGSTERMIRQLDQFLARSNRSFGEMSDAEVEQLTFEDIGQISRVII